MAMFSRSRKTAMVALGALWEVLMSEL